MKIITQPIDKVVWIHRSKLRANAYNPNHVAPPELDLLELSILEDGWTQPIVVDAKNNIIDGYHRYLVSDRAKLKKRDQGMVPTVVMNPTDENHRRFSTIRHNRARGTHAVLAMSDIMKFIIESGMDQKEIMQRLGMEKDEVIRLGTFAGVPTSEKVKQHEYSKSWKPK